VYREPIAATASVTTIQAVAIKDGWYGSGISSGSFYKTTVEPDTIWFTSLPDRKYFAKGARTLIDGEGGITNFSSYEGWVGFRENEMGADAMFATAVKMHSVTLSTRYNHGAFLFPPAVIKVWGGKENGNLKLLSTVHPSQPSGYESGMQAGLECHFPEQEIRFIRIVAEPVAKLPNWHRKKGEKAWFFVDEILFN
jgi:hypothetical protein